MGTDIHGVFQKRSGDQWEDIPTKYDEERHYYLFSILAGVRNGYGFAGVPTYTPVVPISEPRGLPDDFHMEGEGHPVQTLELMGRRGQWREEGEPLEVWMGDHTHSWLTADEILKYAQQHADGVVKEVGILSVEQYRAWDRARPPESFCRGVSGPSMLISKPATISDATTHVEVSWVRPAMSGVDYFVEEVARLKQEHGEVRFVFGFDS